MAFFITLYIYLINNKYWKGQKSGVYSVLETILLVYLIKDIINNILGLIAQKINLRLNDQNLWL